jgi:MFS family permease
MHGLQNLMYGCCCCCCCNSVGIIVASLLVDRAGRLILLRVSSLLAIATLAVLVGLSSFHATQQAAHSVKTLRHWAWLQLVVLSVLSVSGGRVCAAPCCVHGDTELG